MGTFTYKAVEADGRVVKGRVEGADMKSARESVISSGAYLVSIRPVSELLVKISGRLLARSVKRTDVIEFAKNLSVMLSSGIPIMTALGDLESSHANEHFRRALKEIRAEIGLGSGLSDALERQTGVFPDVLVRLVKIGEETGSLDKSLLDAAEHLQRTEDLAESIKRALIYPAFAVVTTFGALLFWMVYVLPKVMDIFKGMGLELPLPTRILLAASSFSQSYWYLLALTPVLAPAAVMLLRKNRGALYYIDLAAIRLPVVSRIVYNKLLAMFSEQLRILTTAGITIDRSLSIVHDIIGNEVFRRSISVLREEISAGSRVSDVMRTQDVFPPLMARMVDVGETSGSLDEQFEYLSKHYHARLDDVSEKIGKILEPLVIGVIGALFALIIMGLLLPVYDLVSMMG